LLFHISYDTIIVILIFSMPNMSYVRFENTYYDLKDCFDHLEDTDLSSNEQSYRKKLIDLCDQIREYIEEEKEENDDEEFKEY